MSKKLKVESPRDFATYIGETLNWSMQAVEDYFDIGEDKQGNFYAKLREKKWLRETENFKALCALARDLGGDYIKEEFTWRVPGPLAKKQPNTQSPEHGIDSEPAYKEPRNAIPSEPSKPVSLQPYQMIPVDAILSMPFQIRQSKEDDLELVETVQQLGVVQPIIVRVKESGRYELVAGSRRLVAAKAAHLPVIPCVVRTLSDQQAYEIMLIENLHRKDLTDIEKARAFDHMIKTFKCTQEELARKLGKTQGWISQHLQMLDLEKDENITRVIKDTQLEQLSEKQAREILAAPSEKREEIAKQIEETGVVPSSREIHKAVKGPDLVCGLCHTAITSEPTHLDGKFYHEDCSQKVVFKPPDFEPTPIEEEPTTGLPKKFEHPPHEPLPTPGASAPRPEAIDIGEFTCTECGKVFHIEHVSDNKHKLVPVTKL